MEGGGRLVFPDVSKERNTGLFKGRGFQEERSDDIHSNRIALLKQQSVVTQKLRRTDVLSLVDSWVTNTASEKHLVSTKKNFLYCRKNMMCLKVGLLRMCKVFPRPVKLYISVLR